MRSHDDDRMTPEIAGALLAIDATLEGEAVDPEYADLAELSLLIRRERPPVVDGFATSMDERVERRFAVPRAARPARRLRWLWAPGAAVAAAVAGVAVVIVVAGGNGGVSSNGALFKSAGTSSSASATTVASSSAASAGPSTPARQLSAVAPDVRRDGRAAARPSAANSTTSAAHGTAAGGSPGSSSSSAGSLAAAPTPATAPGGKRQIVQSAQIQLSTAPSRIDDVAQQVFDVMQAQNGIVNSSNVTATRTTDGDASFQLSVPSANLSATLAALSRLHGATVVSRSDATADITGQVGGAGERLAVARALRRSLLRQLAAAVTTTQVDSIKLQLRSADASINSDLSTLRGLQRQVAYSRIALTIQAATPPPPPRSQGSSFTIGRAAHDAGRVLVVVAGVALIVLAVMVPVGLVAALAAWVAIAVRRRRREHALDLV